MTRARATMDGMSLAWLEQQVPGGRLPQLVEFALRHGTGYGDYASSRSLNERPDTKAWFDEAKVNNLKLLAELVPELAGECNRQIEELCRDRLE